MVDLLDAHAHATVSKIAHAPLLSLQLSFPQAHAHLSLLAAAKATSHPSADTHDSPVSSEPHLVFSAPRFPHTNAHHVRPSPSPRSAGSQTHHRHQALALRCPRPSAHRRFRPIMDLETDQPAREAPGHGDAGRSVSSRLVWLCLLSLFSVAKRVELTSLCCDAWVCLCVYV